MKLLRRDARSLLAVLRQTQSRNIIFHLEITLTGQAAPTLYSLTHLAQLFTDSYALMRPARVEKQRSYRRAIAAGEDPNSNISADMPHLHGPAYDLAVTFVDDPQPISATQSNIYILSTADRVQLGREMQELGEDMAREGRTDSKEVEQRVYEWVVRPGTFLLQVEISLHGRIRHNWEAKVQGSLTLRRLLQVENKA